MTFTMGELTHDVLDVVTAHQLLHYVKNGETRRIRFVTGATTAAVCYVYGPKLEDLFHTLPDRDLSDLVSKNNLRAAGLAVAGAGAGYLIGSRIDPTKFTPLNALLQRKFDDAKKDPEEQNAMVETALTAGSALWLGYSLLFKERSPDDRHRQLWGLGGAAVGYLFGPELIHKTRNLVLPEGAQENIRAVYQRGFAALGALGGGAIATRFRPGYGEKSYGETTTPLIPPITIPGGEKQ